MALSLPPAPPSDTLPDAEAAYFALIAAMPVERKLAMWQRAMTMGRQLTLATIVEREPDLSPAERLHRLCAAWYGQDLADRAYGARLPR